MKLRTAILVACLAPLIHAQTPPTSGTQSKEQLNFEVATVKKSDPAPANQGGGIRPLAGGETYVATRVPLRLMIKLMYRLTDEQIVGGPDWMNTDLWDVRGKAEKPSTVDELHIMFQNLLVDRFKLKIKRETRTQSAFILSVDKSGSKMTPNPSPEPFDFPIQNPGQVTPPNPPKFIGKHVAMYYLCWWLSQGGVPTGVNHPVVDKTGLAGFYDFTLEFAPDLSGRRGPNGETPPTFDGPDIFTALRQQLGLKLESGKGPVEVFVIESAEKPADN